MVFLTLILIAKNENGHKDKNDNGLNIYIENQ